ncbi:MAG: SpoIIE family protein phosphatase [Planctomycetota bacterium]|nr:SpoIIE family protein phosphatase [Planctomycetota bacterium]
MWRVHVLVSGRETGVFDCFDGREMVVGRDPAADIVVPERSVSRRHCRVVGAADGVDVLDLGSANGVYSSGRSVQRIRLGEGEEVQIGMAHLRASKATNRTGMIPIQGFVETASGGPVDDPSTASLSDSSRSILDASNTAYKELEKERLALLIEAGKSLSQALELDDLFERIMDHLFQILQVRRAVLVLREADGRLEPRCLRPETEQRELSEVASQSILRTVMESGKPQIIDDAQLDTGLNMAQSILAANIKAAICAPLTSHNRVIGALYADYPGRAQLYRRSDLDFFGAFASLAAVALDNARMQSELRERERLQLDLQIAAEIQLGLLPDDSLDAPGFEMDWAYVPSKHVGGDFYDCTVIDDDKVALVLGDVAGKSIGAALFMARLMSFLRATVPEDPSPGSVLTRTNALLGAPADRVLFATACYMVVSRSEGKLRYASAGHNPALILEPETEDFKELGATGIPLGIDADYVYEGSDIAVAPGALVVLYTDGIVEARNSAGEQFGLEKLKLLIREHRDAPVKDVTRALNETIVVWCRGSTYTRDDIAIVVVRISG